VPPPTPGELLAFLDTREGEGEATDQDRPPPPPVNLAELDREIAQELEASLAGFRAPDLLRGPAYGSAAADRPGPALQRGRVLAVHGRDVFVAVPGCRSPGVVPAAHFPQGVPTIGSEVTFRVEGHDTDHGLFLLSRFDPAVEAAWSRLAREAVVQGRVIGLSGAGLTLDIDGWHARMPLDQVHRYSMKDSKVFWVVNPETERCAKLSVTPGSPGDVKQFLNQTLRCLVTEADPGQRRLVVSRRALLEKEREESELHMPQRVPLFKLEAELGLEAKELLDICRQAGIAVLENGLVPNLSFLTPEQSELLRQRVKSRASGPPTAPARPPVVPVLPRPPVPPPNVPRPGAGSAGRAGKVIAQGDSDVDNSTQAEELARREAECRRKEQFLNAQEAKLKEETASLYKKMEEQKRKLDAQESDLRKRLMEEVRLKREEVSREMDEYRKKIHSELDDQLRKRREDEERELRASAERQRAEARDQTEAYRQQLRADLEQEIRQWREARRADLDAEWQRLQTQEQAHQHALVAFAEAEKQLRDREAVCRRQERDLKELKADLEADRRNLETLVQRKAGAELQNLRDDRTRAEANRAYLLDQIKDLEERLRIREELAHRFGDENTPEKVKQLVDQRNQLEADVNRLKAQFDRYPTEQELEQLRADARNLRESTQECKRLREEVQSLRSDQHRQLVAESELEGARQDFKRVNEENKRLRVELEERLKRNGPVLERDARIGQIQQPRFTIQRPDRADKVKEPEWLERVFTGIRDAGFEFPRRLFYAFHTSLKIAEWSPLTVLAGVSGTGKSELPRLYALLGGLPFEAVSVQPNWDSPQDLFGFFNYMDNCFNPKPLLQALVQSQRPRREGGFDDGLLLVLLDEMNLARVELYFSDLLSMLELRRGQREPMKLPIDLGSGLPKYEVPLGRNVLFAGTMNEDETTHALSDKALDRSNVLSFPRRVSLRSRDTLTLPGPGRFLPYGQWQGWLKEPKEVLSEAQRDQFRKALERVNEHLAAVRRALGHRVWQALESYIANHPLVCNADPAGLPAAARFAFEDQLVQKVMPKLRGVETTGADRKKCLDPILRILSAEAPGLEADFKMACESPDGTFTWYSKEYLKVEGT
jgi:hypothetical protein